MNGLRPANSFWPGEKSSPGCSKERRELPWERVDKTYVFDRPGGKETLPELFQGRSPLIVYHFMFDPSWEAGCLHCSFWADNFNGIDVHLNHRRCNHGCYLAPAAG
jgi:predicted dithiol-disulfide oxidoreductase (DUF899 family)